MNMNAQIRILIVLPILLLVFGCAASVENRRINNIEYVQKNLIGNGRERPINYGRDIFETLKAANSQTLKQPEIASAYLDGMATYTNLTTKLTILTSLFSG